jgi:cbb3-type cytochrome oxidase subunit 3
MDINDLRALVTVAGFGLFVALALRTWSRGRRAEHDAAARLPFAGDIEQKGEQP